MEETKILLGNKVNLVSLSDMLPLEVVIFKIHYGVDVKGMEELQLYLLIQGL